ncbi:hypothetical protein VKT23_007903 [Stygiomarasmius scandens]|uniref:Uncharacterized protein n=1 Tax=Marasmiellus scandens TaxID=2682957 RepID=A0ABR1JJK3_9AGAR
MMNLFIQTFRSYSTRSHGIDPRISSRILLRFEQIALKENLSPESNPKEYWRRRRNFISSEVRREFSKSSGVDVNSLEGWQKLCDTVSGSNSTTITTDAAPNTRNTRTRNRSRPRRVAVAGTTATAAAAVAITNSSTINSFKAYAASQNLIPGTKEHREERRRYISEQVREKFTRLFGVDVMSLKGWKKICETVLGGAKGKRAVNLEELNTIEDCKDKLKDKFVNLIDLVEYAEEKKNLPRRLVFESEEALRDYSKAEKKIFPKEDAKKVPLLKQFLIVIFVY